MKKNKDKETTTTMVIEKSDATVLAETVSNMGSSAESASNALMDLASDKMVQNAFLSEGIVVDKGGTAVETGRIIVNDESTAIQLPFKRVVTETLHKLTPQGRIDWEALFNPEYFVYPNNDHSRDPLLKVDGLRDLAEVRGIEWKETKFQAVSENMVVVSVKIKFTPNQDDPNGRIWEAVADATPVNVGGKQFSKYLATIAETRATGRCIREALGIRLCTFEEVSKDDLGYTDSSDQRIADETIVALKRQMELKGVDQDVLMKRIQKAYPHIASLNQLTVGQGREFLKWLSEKTNI